MSAGDVRLPGHLAADGVSAFMEESSSESVFLPRMDRLTSSAITTIPRHVSPTCMGALGPARAEVPQKVENGLLSCVVTVVDARPLGPGL